MAEVRYATGIQLDDEPIFRITYNPSPLNDGATLDMLVKGEMSESGLNRWNRSSRFGKIGKNSEFNFVLSERLRVLPEAKSFEPLRDVVRHGALLRQAGFAEAVE